MSFKQELEELTNGHNIEGAFFYAPDEITNYQCLKSEHKSYQENTAYIIYQLNPLIRILSRKRDIISKELMSDLYDDNNLCIILEWNDHSRKVFIFKSDEDLSHILNKNHEELKKLFQKYFYQWRNN